MSKTTLDKCYLKFLSFGQLALPMMCVLVIHYDYSSENWGIYSEKKVTRYVSKYDMSRLFFLADSILTIIDQI